jgi:serine/threonine-protein kinase
MMDLPAGPKKIGKYDVLSVLGRGGMGVVYKAVDSRIKRMVAIKMMTSDAAKDPDYLKRFYREAQSTGALQHPNIVVVYDLGEEEGNPYLVMEYLEGITLDKIVSARTPLSLYEKLNIIVQVLDGLAYAHQRGIVHRDVKPQNIMVLRDRTVKIVDFGIARMGPTGLTRTGQVIGTISYMSPEQINAQAVDGRSDIFAAAVVLYELITCALPFEGRDTTSTIMKILQEPAPPLQEKAAIPHPEELEKVLHKALAKNRDERYQLASDFEMELAQVRDRLKHGMIADYLSRGKSALERGELVSARELLQQLAKIDPQHPEGRELLQQAQEKLLQQQRHDQVRQLSAEALEALQHGSCDDALALAEQALGLDKNNSELQGLRNRIQEAKFKKDSIEAGLRRAAAAQQAGELEAAQRAVEEALAVDPGHPQAKALQAAVLKLRDEQTRARQLAQLIDNARLNMQSRCYTVASDLLRQARSIDPENLEVQVLLREAQEAHTEETARRQVEALTRMVEEALAIGDRQTAEEKCKEALQLAPADVHLLQLRRQAEQLRDAAAQKQAAEQAVEQARALVNAGKTAEALAAMEAARKQFPSDARIASVLAALQPAVDREKNEKLKREYLAKAQAALDAHDYAAALEILKAAGTALPEAPEIERLRKFAEEELARQPAPSPPPAAAADPGLLREMGKTLGKAQQLAAGGRVAEALQLLETNAAVFGKNADFQQVLAELKALASRPPAAVKPVAARAPEAPKKGGSKALLTVFAVLLVLAGLGAGAYWVKGRRAATKMVVAADTAYIEVYAVPWGTVTSVASTDGSVSRALNDATPVRLSVPPGEYKIVVTGPSGQEQSQIIKVADDAPASYQPVFGEVDVQQIISGSK